MEEFLLFVDTETTGLPKNWTAPYNCSDKWPGAVQIAWIVCDRMGQELKRENLYISDNDLPMSASALATHRLDTGFLSNNGLPRSQVMRILAHDLQTYEPLVIGHYMQFDYGVISADFERSGVPHNLPDLPLFCTMLASSALARSPYAKYMRLEELYATLFNKKSPDSHDAMRDAILTAACFFELLHRQFISEQDIGKQNILVVQRMPGKQLIYYLIASLFILLLFLLYVLLQKN